MAIIHSEVFTISDVRTLCGLKSQTAEEWYAAKVFRASVRCGNRGVERLFSFGDVFAAHLAASFRAAGYEMDVIRKVSECYYSTAWDAGRCVLTITGGEVSVVTPADANRMIGRGVNVSATNLLVAAKALRDEIDSQLSAVANRECN